MMRPGQRAETDRTHHSSHRTRRSHHYSAYPAPRARHTRRYPSPRPRPGLCAFAGAYPSTSAGTGATPDIVPRYHPPGPTGRTAHLVPASRSGALGVVQHRPSAPVPRATRAQHRYPYPYHCPPRPVHPAHSSPYDLARCSEARRHSESDLPVLRCISPVLAHGPVAPSKPR